VLATTTWSLAVPAQTITSYLSLPFLDYPPAGVRPFVVATVVAAVLSVVLIGGAARRRAVHERGTPASEYKPVVVASSLSLALVVLGVSWLALATPLPEMFGYQRRFTVELLLPATAPLVSLLSLASLRSVHASPRWVVARTVTLAVALYAVAVVIIVWNYRTPA
jgi:hypothetical protein